MKAVVFDDDAKRDIDSLIAYIAQDNPNAAERVRARVLAAIDKIASMPTGRAGRVEGTLERPVRGLPYVIAFDLPAPDTLRILRIIHTSRDWPAGGWPE